jgi:hypothetical protein
MRNTKQGGDAVDVQPFSFAMTEVNVDLGLNPLTGGIVELLFGCSAPRANCVGRLPA